MMKAFRLGLVCTNYDRSLSTNKSFRLASLGKEKLFETVKSNIQGFIGLSHYCAENSIPMLRLGNAFIPFASHEKFEKSWWNELEIMLKDAKSDLPSNQPRITIHPGQFIQLGSSSTNVIQSSLKELEYCHRLLSILGDESSVITLHIGGKKDGKEVVFERFYKTFLQNLWLKDFLALENDEHNFNAKETLELSKLCNIPTIFDIFHHSINQSEVNWMQIKETWGSKRPKVHLSSQGDGPVGMHSIFIEKGDFKSLIAFLGNDASCVDIMIEAKGKEKAIHDLMK